MFHIEKDYQTFSTQLLQYVLIPYWWEHKHGLVESKVDEPDLCEALRNCLGKTDADAELVRAPLIMRCASRRPKSFSPSATSP